jgi:hypothetical protein
MNGEKKVYWTHFAYVEASKENTARLEALVGSSAHVRKFCDRSSSTLSTPHPPELLQIRGLE